MPCAQLTEKTGYWAVTAMRWSFDRVTGYGPNMSEGVVPCGPSAIHMQHTVCWPSSTREHFPVDRAALQSSNVRV